MKVMRRPFLYVLCLSLTNCFYFISSVRKMEKALERGECRQAKLLFSSIEENQSKKIRLAKKAAEKCLYASKRKEAIWFYQYLSKRENSKEKRLLFKKKLAQIYFEEVKNYEKAIELYSFLMKQDTLDLEKQLYSFRIAVAFFEMGKWEASLRQVEVILSSTKEGKDRGWVNRMFLKGRILLMQEKYKAAEAVFKKIQQIDPVFFRENKIVFYLSLIYELRKEFHQAISELEGFQSTSDFLMNKIRRLKVREDNQPGAAIR